MREEVDEMVFTSAQIAHILEETTDERWALKEWVPLQEEALDEDLESDDEFDDEEGDDDWVPDDARVVEDEAEEEELPKTLVVTTKDGAPEDVDPVHVDESDVPPPPPKKEEEKKEKPKKEKKEKRGFFGKKKKEPEKPKEPEGPRCIASDCRKPLAKGEKGMCLSCKRKHGVVLE